MSVAVGFSAYLQDLGDNLFGFHLPAAIAFPMFAAPGQPNGIFNIPALLITLLVTWVLVRGVRESAGANTVMVLIKIAAIADLLLRARPARFIPANWKPFAPHGFSGILTGASIVFFTYIGFDSVSTAAEECRESAARYAVRHHRHADRLHHSLWLGGAGAHRHRALSRR